MITATEEAARGTGGVIRETVAMVMILEVKTGDGIGVVIKTIKATTIVTEEIRTTIDQRVTAIKAAGGADPMMAMMMDLRVIDPIEEVVAEEEMIETATMIMEMMEDHLISAVKAVKIVDSLERTRVS